MSDRDFALDYLFALSGIATHLSRLAEDLVIFASQEFAYVILPDEYATGSSLMPQKKNPDAWELIRGKTGRITGALVALLTTMKGLPTSYQRDLQEDKETLFAAHDQIASMTCDRDRRRRGHEIQCRTPARCRVESTFVRYRRRGLPGASRPPVPPSARHHREARVRGRAT